MAQGAGSLSVERNVAELEDTGTTLNSNTLESAPPTYMSAEQPVNNLVLSPEKATITSIDDLYRRTIPKRKQPVAATPNDKEVNTLKARSTAGKEVVSSEASSTLVSSPTATSLTNSSHVKVGRQISRTYREFSFWHTAPWRPTHNVITDPESGARYFIEVSEFTKGKQDVSIHDVAEGHPAAVLKGDRISVDEGKASPIVGFAQFPSGNNNLARLGLGDPNNMAEVKWVNMKTEPDSDDWALFVPTSGANREITKVYHFCTTKTNSASSDMEPSTPSTVQTQQSFSFVPSVGTYAFIDDDSNTTLAIYSENKLSKTWKKRGKLRMYEREPASNISAEELELLVVLCCTVTNEKRRRKTWRKWALIG